jgi:signal transduction histidine kinase
MWHSIQIKIMAAVGVILLASVALLVFFIAQTHENQLLRQAILYTSRMSDMAEKGVRQEMLQHKRNEIMNIFDDFTQEDELEKIRLYDKEGIVVLSTDKSEINAKINMRHEMCVKCHISSSPLVLPATLERGRIFQGDDGDRRLAVIAPIYNAPPCYECHDKKQKVLGVIDAVFLLKGVDMSIRRVWSTSVISGIIAILLSWACIAVTVKRFVRKPIKSLLQATQRIARGDLETTIPITSQDEMGKLCAAFNSMSLNLKKAADENSRWNKELEKKVKIATQKLEVANQSLRDAYQQKSEFIRTVVHQLRAPVAGMQSFLKLITSHIIGELNPKQQEMLERANKKCALLLATVNDLLDMAAVSENTRRSPAESLDLNTIAVQCMEQFSPLAQKKGIRILLVRESENAPVTATVRDLEYAISNLLANAVNYTQTGKVSITVRNEKDHVVLTVSDTGIGIPEEDIPHCFKDFYRGDNVTEHLYEGTGLGLSIVKKVVDKYGGKIKLESKLNIGTTITLSFPKEKT